MNPFLTSRKSMPHLVKALQSLVNTVVVDYSKLWFKQTDDLEWYCLLCKAYTTEGHVKSERHVKGAEAILGWAAGDGNGVFFVFFCFLFVLFLFTALTKSHA